MSKQGCVWLFSGGSRRPLNALRPVERLTSCSSRKLGEILEYRPLKPRSKRVPNEGRGGVSGRSRSAAAGAAAATVWALQEPLDQKVLRCDYSDVALLGKAVTRGPGWRIAGLAIHTVNGAIFGLVFHELRRRLRVDSGRLALGMALGEHVSLYPLCYFIDRYHPARGEHGVPPLLTNPRAFAQATWRHTLFAVVLGRLSHPRRPEPGDAWRT